MSVIKRTNSLQWIKKKIEGSIYTDKQKVLQQAWVDTKTGEITWQDVPEAKDREDEVGIKDETRTVSLESCYQSQDANR